MKRIAALDFGKARIGVAFSDPLHKIAFPQKSILAKKQLEQTATHVHAELQRHGPFELILIGLPLFLNGKESPMSQEVRRFGQLLQEKFGLQIIFWDERLTTAQGDKLLREADVKRRQREKVLDGIAAAILLQNYLDAKCLARM